MLKSEENPSDNLLRVACSKSEEYNITRRCFGVQIGGRLASQLVFFSVRLELGKDGPAALPRHYGPSDLHLIAAYLKDGGRAYSQLHRALLARVQDAGLEALLEPPQAPPAEAPAVDNRADRALQMVGLETRAGEESGKGGDKSQKALSVVGEKGASRLGLGEADASENPSPAGELTPGGPQVAETGVRNELAPEASKETSPKRPSLKPTANPPPQLLTSPSPSPSTRDANTSLRQIESGQKLEHVADVRLASSSGAGQTKRGACGPEASMKKYEGGLEAAAEKVCGENETSDKVVETCTVTPKEFEDRKVSTEGPGAEAGTGEASEKGSGGGAEATFKEATPSGKADTIVDTAVRAAECLGNPKSGEEKEAGLIVKEAGGIGNGAAVMASAVVPVEESTVDLVGGINGTELGDARKGGAVSETVLASDGAGQSCHNNVGGIVEARDLLTGNGQGTETLEMAEPLAGGVRSLGVSNVRKLPVAGVSQDQVGLPTEAGSALAVLDGSARQFVEGSQTGTRALEVSQVGVTDSQPLVGVTGGFGSLGVVAGSALPAPGGLEGLGMADVSGDKRHLGDRDPLTCHESALFDFDNIEDLVEKLAREQGYLVETGPPQSRRAEPITTGSVAGGVDSAAQQSGLVNLPLQSVTTFPQHMRHDSPLPAGQPKSQGPVGASNRLPFSSPLSGLATGRPEQGPNKRQKLEQPPLYQTQASSLLSPLFQAPSEAFAPPTFPSGKPEASSENRQENVSALNAASPLALPLAVTGLGQPHVPLPVHSAMCPPPLLNPTHIGAAAVADDLVNSISMTSADSAGAPDLTPAQKPPQPKLRWPFDDVSAVVPSPKPTLGSGQTPPSLTPPSGGPVSGPGQPLPSGTRPRAKPMTAKTRPPSGCLVGRNSQLAKVGIGGPLPSSTEPSAPTDPAPLKPYESYENRYVQGGLAAQAAAQLQEMGDKKESVAKASGKCSLSCSRKKRKEVSFAGE
jgi:hypothetical protein